MPYALPRIARILAANLNLLFLSISLVLLSFVCLAAINPPKADVSPERVNNYPQYIVTILLIASYSICLFLLSVLGLFSLCILNSFLISLHIIGQIAMISAQLIAIAFTVTVRKRLHHKLELSWRGKEDCKIGEPKCLPLERFLTSESILILFLCLFFVLQVILLVASGFLAERQSYEERYRLRLQKEDEDDD